MLQALQNATLSSPYQNILIILCACVRKRLLRGAAAARGLFKINHEKNRIHFLLIAQQVLQNFLGDPHMRETRIRQVTEAAKLKVVGHA